MYQCVREMVLTEVVCSCPVVRVVVMCSFSAVKQYGSAYRSDMRLSDNAVVNGKQYGSVQQ